MAFSFQPLDQALDSLGFSYVDGVTVKIAPKYTVDCDLSQVQDILNKPAPSILAFDSNYDTSYEKKVLEDLETRAQTEKIKKEDRRKRIEEYERKKKEDVEKKKKEEEEKALEDERKRLQEIEDEKKAKLEADQRRMEEEKRLLEEAEALRKKHEEEAEWKKFEEERCRKESESCDKSEDDSTNDNFRTPPQEPKTPDELKDEKPKTEIPVVDTVNKEQNYTKITNFSDFEGTSSDPFADLELKSINDLAELQTILSSVTPSQPPVSNTYRSPPATYHPPHQQPPNYLSSSMTPSQALATRLAHTSFTPPAPPGQAHGNYPGYNYTSSGYQPQYYYNQYGQPPPQPLQGYQHNNVNSNTAAFTIYNTVTASSPSYQSQTSTTTVSNNLTPDLSKVRSVSSDRDRHRTEKLKDGSDNVPSNGELKPSRSMGDMISELQKEVEELQQQKKKSPSSSSRPTSRGATGLENWTPWPQLDQEQTLTNGGGPGPGADEACLDGLRAEDARLCRQLHEMGFPLPRLAKGVSAVGANSQKLINFCLVVDRWDSLVHGLIDNLDLLQT